MFLKAKVFLHTYKPNEIHTQGAVFSYKDENYSAIAEKPTQFY
jgi:hypothetical protein